jgi:hypothetical protein
MTRVAGVVFLVCASLGSAACGGNSPRPRVVTVNALDQGTRASHTARITGQQTSRDGNTTTVLHATGELNFDQNATHIRAAGSNGKVRFDVIVIGTKGYARGTADELLTPNWCPIDITVSVDPGAVLKSLTNSHVTLDRIGDETISGVETTHYHAVRTDTDEVLELWVDAQDRLRRMIDTSGSTTSTADLYDFGEPIPPIQAPVTSGCPASGSDGASSSVSVTPTSDAP